MAQIGQVGAHAADELAKVAPNVRRQPVLPRELHEAAKEPRPPRAHEKLPRQPNGAIIEVQAQAVDKAEAVLWPRRCQRAQPLRQRPDLRGGAGDQGVPARGDAPLRLHGCRELLDRRLGAAPVVPQHEGMAPRRSETPQQLALGREGGRRAPRVLVPAVASESWQRLVFAKVLLPTDAPAGPDQDVLVFDDVRELSGLVRETKWAAKPPLLRPGDWCGLAVARQAEAEQSRPEGER